MTETSKEAACAGIVEDIAALARKLAEKEPFESASGPEALRAFAAHLEAMVTSPGHGRAAAVTVAVRQRRKKSA